MFYLTIDIDEVEYKTHIHILINANININTFSYGSNQNIKTRFFRTVVISKEKLSFSRTFRSERAAIAMFLDRLPGLNVCKSDDDG